MVSGCDGGEGFYGALRHHQAGRLGDAERAYRAFLTRDTGNADALHLLGVVCLQTSRVDEAADFIRRSLAVRPESPVALNTLGLILESREELAGAENTYRHAIQLRPAYGEAWHNLGNLLVKRSRPEDAVEAYREAARLRPDDPDVRGAAAIGLVESGRLAEALEHFRARAELSRGTEAGPGFDSALLFWMLHDPDVSDEALFEEHVAWARRHADGLAQDAAPHDNDRDPERPVRVGYVSPDFRSHVMARFVEPVITNHDRRSVTTVCYSDAAEPDEVTQRFRAAAGAWRDTADLSDEQLSELVRADRIDVLVDLSGHIGRHRLLAFARRPAPVQVTYCGYSHSTGLAAMGYRLTDALADPPGVSDRYYVEQVVRLPGSAWCYRPTESPEVNDAPAASQGYVTFGSLNRVAKLSPAVARLWARVLEAAPQSRLLVLAGAGERNENVRRMLEDAGVSAERLRLVPGRAVGRDGYLRYCHEIDVALDPLPYNGTTTTCDLLCGWACRW